MVMSVVFYIVQQEIQKGDIIYVITKLLHVYMKPITGGFALKTECTALFPMGILT